MQLVVELEGLSVERARAGDPAAWDSLLRRHQLPLYTFIRQIIRDEQVALDIVQETFAAAVKHLAGLREDAKFSSWLFGIAHQKCIHFWRRHRITVSLDDGEVETLFQDDDSPEDILIRKEEEEAFMDLVNALPLAQRTVLLLHYLEDFSLEEIAAITETNAGTVKSRLHYARQALRKLVENRL